MCGRFALALPPKSLAEHFQLDMLPDTVPRYNIAPTQNVATISTGTDIKSLGLKMRRWGLIPHWAEDIKIGARLINARSETAAEKPSFRSAFRRRRCLIPSTGFYEWKRDGAVKQPFFIGLANSSPFAFAGLWERWEKGGDEAVESCTILTTEANDILKPIHDRMPVILHPDTYGRWLDTAVTDPESLKTLLISYPPELMKRYPIGTLVNNPRNDDPMCIEPVDN